jgi:thymidylate kinase
VWEWVAETIRRRDADDRKGLGIMFYEKSMYEEVYRYFCEAMELNPSDCETIDGSEILKEVRSNLEIFFQDNNSLQLEHQLSGEDLGEYR